MNRQRLWSLLGAFLILVCPPTSLGQVILFGAPFGGPRPLTLPSYYYSLGSYNAPLGGYFPYMPSYSYSLTYYPYFGFSSYTTVPLYQPLTYSPLLPVAPAGNLPPSGLEVGSAAPRWRDRFYPLGTGDIRPAGSAPVLGNWAELAPGGGLAGPVAGVPGQWPGESRALSWACAQGLGQIGAMLPLSAGPADYWSGAAVLLNPPPRWRQKWSADPSILPASTVWGSEAARAEVLVRLPRADAELWFDNTPTKQTGKVRRFYTPPLASGRYTYEVRARWQEDGRWRQEVRSIYLHAGDVLEVDFTRAGGGS
jgi:uncharacterized protein (TIGR03000 family)